MPVLKSVVPLAQTEAVAVESHDAVGLSQAIGKAALLPVGNAAGRSVDEQDGEDRDDDRVDLKPELVLIARYLAGDMTAFDELMRRYEKRVAALTWRMLGRPEDVGDAVQQTFLRCAPSCWNMWISTQWQPHHRVSPRAE